MPRRPTKPAGTTADARNGQRVDLSVVGDGRVGKFDAPPISHPQAIAAWDDFWSDRPSALLTPSSKAVLCRWIVALDRYWTASGEADNEPLTTGSTGQSAMNPLYKVAEQAMKIVESCEKQLGIGGLNASTLGLAAISERRSLQDMNGRYETLSSVSPGDLDEDPRLMIIDGG